LVVEDLLADSSAGGSAPAGSPTVCASGAFGPQRPAADRLLAFLGRTP